MKKGMISMNKQEYNPTL